MNIGSLLLGKKKTSVEDVFLSNRAPIRSVPYSLQRTVKRRIAGDHIYIEAGVGKPVIFCHGLLGSLFNVELPCAEIAREYRFIMPYLPMYDRALLDCTVSGLGQYLSEFIEDLGLEEAIVIGSSTGGGASLYYACQERHRLSGLVLCGSSGLSTVPLSKGYLKRREYAFVDEATRDIYYDRSIPTRQMIDDVFGAIQDPEIVLRTIRLSKSATRLRMDHELPRIAVPTLLVWGMQDPITPVSVAPRFRELMPHAHLCIIDQCGHVPTQEKPYQFLEFLFAFLSKIKY